MHAIFQIYEFCAAVIFVYVTVMFFISRLFGNRDDLADVAWGVGFVIIALIGLASSAYNKRLSLVSTTITVLIIIWGSRLSLHIFRRFRRSIGDRRYIEARSKWTSYRQLKSYFVFFVFQGLLMLVIGAPIIIVNAFHSGLSWYIFVGLSVWLVGFYFEAVSDTQLAKFVSNPANKDKLMTAGLWRYSRHPNYFGELSQWWGIGIIVIGAPYGWLGLVGPITISLLIVKVSGIPMAEARLKTRPEWRAYANKTSALLPLPRQFKLRS